MQLKNISKIQAGLSLIRRKGKLYEHHHNYKLITLKSFSKSGRLIDNSFYEFISDEVIPSRYLSKKGDILIRLRTPSFAVFIDQEEHEGLLVSSLIAKITSNKILDGRYLTSYINSNSVQKEMMKKTESKINSMLNIKELNGLKVISPSMNRQQILNNVLAQSQKEITLLKKLLLLKTKLNDERLDTFLKMEADK